MREIGAFEAHSHFVKLPDIVGHGDEVLITRHGREATRLVPDHPSINREAAMAVVQRMRARAEQHRLGRFDWSEWKSCPDEGRPLVWILGGCPPTCLWSDMPWHRAIGSWLDLVARIPSSLRAH